MHMSGNFILDPGKLDLPALRRFVFDSPRVSLSQDAENVLADAARSVDRIVASGAAVYGVNTGFGKLASLPMAPRMLPTDLSVFCGTIRQRA